MERKSINEENIYTRLKRATDNLFYGNGSWGASCFDKSKSNELDRRYLVCNLRNNEWLAKLLAQDEELAGINFDTILSFVESAEFQELRHEYELKVVEWQLSYINGGGRNYVVSISEMIGSGSFPRTAIINTLTSAGMDEQNVIDLIDELSKKYPELSEKSQMESVDYDIGVVAPMSRH